MGKELCDNFDSARETFAVANDVVGFDLQGLCFGGPEGELKLTANTQPAILTVSVAAFKVVQEELGWTAECMAGHSLGEFTALVAAGALRFAEAVRLVRIRGTLMQEAVPVGQGAMAAILGLTREEVEEICRAGAGDQILAPANFNSPGQVVVSGHAEAVARGITLARNKGAKKAVVLQVSAPFHCTLMEAAGRKLGNALDEVTISDVRVPVVTNVEATPNSSKERVKELLVQQMSNPVRWDESIDAMINLGVERFVEIGPGTVLSGLLRRIDRNKDIRNIEDQASLDRLKDATI
jgi:[acyl-carrier-protein] S-malonyltransferase